jgi:hypothetical protein
MTWLAVAQGDGPRVTGCRKGRRWGLITVTERALRPRDTNPCPRKAPFDANGTERNSKAYRHRGTTRYLAPASAERQSAGRNHCSQTGSTPTSPGAGRPQGREKTTRAKPGAWWSFCVLGPPRNDPRPAAKPELPSKHGEAYRQDLAELLGLHRTRTFHRGMGYARMGVRGNRHTLSARTGLLPLSSAPHMWGREKQGRPLHQQLSRPPPRLLGSPAQVAAVQGRFRLSQMERRDPRSNGYAKGQAGHCQRTHILLVALRRDASLVLQVTLG